MIPAGRRDRHPLCRGIEAIAADALATGVELQVDLASATEVDITAIQLLWAAQREAQKQGLAVVAAGPLPESWCSAGTRGRFREISGASGCWRRSQPEKSRSGSEVIDNYKQAFQEEARESLVQLESVLLELGNTPTDTDLVGKAFRALHTIKGSGMMFGFDEVAAFTHHIETAFDAVRSGRLSATPDLINLTLGALDQIKAMLDQAAGHGTADASVAAQILTKVRELTGAPAPASQEKVKGPQETISSGIQKLPSAWLIRFHPGADLLRNGANPLLLFRELRQLGSLQITANTDAIPPIAELEPDRCYVSWDMVLTTAATADEIRDIFIFVEDSCELAIEAAPGPASTAPAVESLAAVETPKTKKPPWGRPPRTPRTTHRVSACQPPNWISLWIWWANWSRSRPDWARSRRVAKIPRSQRCRKKWSA